MSSAGVADSTAALLSQMEAFELATDRWSSAVQRDRQVCIVEFYTGCPRIREEAPARVARGNLAGVGEGSCAATPLKESRVDSSRKKRFEFQARSNGDVRRVGGPGAYGPNNGNSLNPVADSLSLVGSSPERSPLVISSRMPYFRRPRPGCELQAARIFDPKRRNDTDKISEITSCIT